MGGTIARAVMLSSAPAGEREFLSRSGGRFEAVRPVGGPGTKNSGRTTFLPAAIALARIVSLSSLFSDSFSDVKTSSSPCLGGEGLL